METGDTVWVNETTSDGAPLPHEWYGEIDGIGMTTAIVKDTNPKSSFLNQKFHRKFYSLEIKEDN